MRAGLLRVWGVRGRTDAVYLLAVLGVALGVGSVLSIQLLDAGAVGAFAGGVRAVSGEAQLTLVGRGPALDDEVVTGALAVPGVKVALPIVRVDVAVLDRPGLTLEVVGGDLLAPVRLPWGAPRTALAAALGERGWVAVTPELADELGLREGSVLPVASGSRRVSLVVGARVDLRRASPLASRRLAVMDIAQAQALLGTPGKVQQIDLLLAEGADPADVARRLEARLGPSVQALTPEARLAQAGELLRAFRLNLTALSLVSLLVGGFLVYASTQAALARRREELGILRCLGATRAQVARLVLLDAVVLGTLGTALGVPLGWLAARANLAAVSATVQNVYLLEGVERVSLTPGLALLGLALGLAGAFAGALLPALDVAREDPRALLSAPREPASPGRLSLVLAASAAFALAAVAAVTLGPVRRAPVSGFALALAILVAVPLWAPLLLRGAARLPPPRRLSVGYGARDLTAHLRSTAVSTGALAVAVSMLAGITIMIASFRDTVEGWLDATLRADVYVSTPAWRRGRIQATLSPGVVPALAALPGVRAVDRLRQLAAEVDGRRVTVSGFDAGLPQARDRVQLAAGEPAQALGEVVAGAALVSEPLARRAGLGPGGTLRVAAGRGEVTLPIAGVYRDYGAEGGAVLVDLATLERLFGPGPLTNVALTLAPGQDPEAYPARIAAALPDEALVVRSNRRLRADVLRVFDQTFAVTRLLQLMSLLVAVAGVALTLLVLARERSSEVALYRALGATRGQVFLVFVGRALGIALAGLVLGLAGGAGLALVLVEVINPAWFGWTLGLHAPGSVLAGQAALLLGAALAASLYPALRASRTPATELARDAL